MKILKSNLLWFSLFFVGIAAIWYVGKNISSKPRFAPFAIEKIEFDGNEHVADVLLLKVSGLRYKNNIFSYSMNDIKSRLEKIAWVRSVIVQRRLLNRIVIRIVERVPIAILQMKHKLYLVDEDGQVIDHDGIGNFDNLPIVVGEGAGPETPLLLDCLNKFPKLRRQLVFAIWIGNRRWNIKLSRGILVKLPERGLFHALSILEEVSDSNGLFKEDISEIDLRLLDRVVVTKKEQKK